MSEAVPEQPSLFLAFMERLRRPRVMAWSVAVLLALTVIAVLLSISDGPWKTAGSIGSILFPLLMAMWQFADATARSKDSESHDHLVADRVKRALRPLGGQLQEIAATPQDEWTPHRVQMQREGILETVRNLVGDAGVREPRVCLYSVNLAAENTDAEGNQSLDGKAQKTVDVLSYVAHRGRSKPKDLYLRTIAKDDHVTYTSRRNREMSEPVDETNCESLFAPVESRNHTRESSRSNYDERAQNWRSSVRFPVFTGRDVEHLLTVDSQAEDGIPPELDDLIATGVAILRLLASVVDEEIPHRAVGAKIRARIDR